MTQEEFNQEFFLKFPEVWDSCIKVDFLAEKLQAFIHCADTADCDKLITHWEGRPMQNSSKPLQVRYKGENLEVSFSVQVIFAIRDKERKCPKSPLGKHLMVTTRQSCIPPNFYGSGGLGFI